MFASSVPQAVALRVREMGVLLFRVVDTSKDLVESIAPDASSEKWRLLGGRLQPIGALCATKDLSGAGRRLWHGVSVVDDSRSWCGMQVWSRRGITVSKQILREMKSLERRQLGRMARWQRGADDAPERFSLSREDDERLLPGNWCAAYSFCSTANKFVSRRRWQ